jgi:hypothetical protein
MRFRQDQDVEDEVVGRGLGFGTKFVKDSDSVRELVLGWIKWALYGFDADVRYLLTCRAISLA